MKYSVVIPAYNEEQHILSTLNSLVGQTLLPIQVVVVNDSSTDNTAKLAKEFSRKYDFIHVINNQAEAKHLPGSKVINAFNTGFNEVQNNWDFIVKLDADLILPPDYFQRIAETFQSDKTIGMAGGMAYILKNDQWILESLTDDDHIRGAFKSYRKACFEQIGGLPAAMGWDTVDELLAKYHQWQVVVLPELKVKHLKPTGAVYNKAARYKQGEAFYRLGYGIWLTLIASIKLATKKRKLMLFADYINGFYRAKKAKIKPLVTDDQARFIRKYRWKRIKKKLF